jgi:integrase
MEITRADIRKLVDSISKRPAPVSATELGFDQGMDNLGGSSKTFSRYRQPPLSSRQRSRRRDLAAKVWTVPAARAKNGRQHSVPLSAQALDVLAWLAPAFEIPTELVFQPVGFSQSKAKLDAALKSAVSANFTIHDLRWTCASCMAGLGVRIETVEKILNHASGSFRGIVGVYQKYDFAGEKRAALDAWAAHVAALPAPTVALSKGV